MSPSHSPHPHHIPLENSLATVIRKAMNGHGLLPDAVAKKSGVPSDLFNDILSGRMNEEVKSPEAIDAITSIAQTLHLDPVALSEIPTYHPHTPDLEKIPELVQIVTPFGDAGSNVFVLRHGSSATAFDTGTDSSHLLDYLKRENLSLSGIYITHEHHDHIAGIDQLSKKFPVIFPDDLPHGKRFSIHHGELHITALETSGHFTPSRAYLIEGLSVPICPCGDILFAGSMGKTASPDLFQKSLKHARDHLFSLPNNTLLCPGHGPITTVGEEKKYNPFFASNN